MRKRGFSNFPRYFRHLASPIPEAASEAVDGGVEFHPAQDHVHRHVGQRLLAAAARKYVSTESGKGLQELDSAAGERYAMFPAGFHAVSRNGPDPRLKIELLPRQV